MPKQSKKKGKAFIKPAGQSINNKWEVNDVTSEYGKSDENDASDMENVQGMISSHHICESINNTNFFNDKFKVSCFLSNGVSNALYLQIKENSPFTDTEWTTYLDISIKTLQRYIKDETHIFKSAHSEKIIETILLMVKNTQLCFRQYQANRTHKKFIRKRVGNGSFK